MTHQRKRNLLFLVTMVLCFVLLPLALHAMQAPVSPTPTPAPASAVIAQNIVIVAGIVAALLQGLKKMFPQIQGNIAIILSVVGSLAAAYAVAPAGNVLNIQFLVSALGGALGANGIHSFLRTARSPQK